LAPVGGHRRIGHAHVPEEMTVKIDVQGGARSGLRQPKVDCAEQGHDSWRNLKQEQGPLPEITFVANTGTHVCLSLWPPHPSHP